MLRLLGVVISIAFADSLNPSTIGPALFLGGGRRPVRDILAFTAGTTLVFFVGGMALVLGPGRIILALVPHPDATARYTLELVAGIAMLVVGAFLWKRREALGRPAATAEAAPARRSAGFTGATIALVELPTAFPYFAAIAAIVGSGESLAGQTIFTAIYNVVFIAPLLGIALAIQLTGERAVSRLVELRMFIHEHWAPIAAGLALAAGVFATVLGATGLAAGAPGGVGSIARRVRHLISHGSLFPKGSG